MARVLHGISIDTLPEPGEIKDNDQMVAYRQEDGKAYRTDVASLVMGDFVDKIYPVGSIYMSMTQTDPGNLFGGTWEQINDCFLLASGSREVGAVGGSETVGLTSSQLPSHTHSMPSHTHSIPKLSGTAASAGSHTHMLQYYPNYVPSGTAYPLVNTLGTSTTTNGIPSAGSHTHSVTTNSSTSGSTSGTSGSTGSGEEHDNMPPYMAVYMWQRIA